MGQILPISIHRVFPKVNNSTLCGVMKLFDRVASMQGTVWFTEDSEAGRDTAPAACGSRYLGR